MAPEKAAAQAQTSEEYKRIIESAVLEFDSGNWAEARVLFEHAHSLRPSARTLRGMGKASFELKDYVRAERELVSSLTELRMPLSDPQRQEITTLLVRIAKFIGVLKIVVKPESVDATVVVDGSVVEGELRLNLGQHDLSVQADGYQSLNRTIQVEGGKKQRLQLTLNRSLPESSVALQPTAAGQAHERESLAFTGQAANGPRSDQSGGLLQRWWFWTIVGVAVAGGAAAAVVLTTQKVPAAPEPGNTGLSVHVLTLGHQ